MVAWQRQQINFSKVKKSVVEEVSTCGSLTPSKCLSGFDKTWYLNLHFL